jgi:peptidyl-prolyl cis-trans isomerase D
VAEELGLEIKTSDIFTREGGEGIAENRNFINAAFSDEVIDDDVNSAVIELDKSHLVVLHKKEHIEESELPYDVVAASIKEGLKLRKARTKARELGESYIEQLSNGADVESLFSENTWQKSQTISRLEGSLNREIIDSAFAMKKPVTQPGYNGFSASNGNYIVVKLNQVLEGDISGVTKEERNSVAAYLSRSSGQDQLRAFIDSLKLDADIDIMLVVTDGKE